MKFPIADIGARRAGSASGDGEIKGDYLAAVQTVGGVQGHAAPVFVPRVCPGREGSAKLDAGHRFTVGFH
jgi:hypothetical protein